MIWSFQNFDRIFEYLANLPIKIKKEDNHIIYSGLERWVSG